MLIPRPSISEVWESYDGRLTGREVGGWRKATCVLHKDMTPSASVNESEGKWKCYHEDDSYGDVIELIMRVENVEFAGACAIAKGLDGDSHGSVRESGGSGTGLLPHRQGHRPGRRAWVPPWKSM